MKKTRPAGRASSDAFERRIDRLMLATPEATDPLLDSSLTEMLRLVREHLAMDVVFVAQQVGAYNVFRRVDADPELQSLEGTSHPLADSYCQRVLDGRLPAVMPDVPALRLTHDCPPESRIPIGAYMAVPVRLQDGTLYGTLCCFSFQPNKRLGERELKRLQMSARLAARLIDSAAGRHDHLRVS